MRGKFHFLQNHVESKVMDNSLNKKVNLLSSRAHLNKTVDKSANEKADNLSMNRGHKRV